MNVKSIFWSWNKGKTLFEVNYDNNETHTIKSDIIPPTTPSHDIAHALCCFNNLPWNFKVHINEIAEYNAVHMESIFTRFCKYYLEDIRMPIEHHIEENIIRTNDFSENYYQIPKNCSISTLDLETLFMEAIDPETCSYFIKDYLNVYKMEQMVKKEELVTSYNLQKNIEKKSDSFSRFLTDYKKIYFKYYNK